MMNLSRRFPRSFGLIPITVFAVGCAQSGASPTSPSALAAPAAAAVSPGADYNATGRWHFEGTSDNPGLQGPPFDTDVTQDPVTGNLSFYTDEDELIVLERLSAGAGAVITYRIGPVVSVEGSGPCDLVRVMATGRLDTLTNTLTLPIRLKQVTGCDNLRAEVVMTGTKLN
jgi:hypothetical protein